MYKLSITSFVKVIGLFFCFCCLTTIKAEIPPYLNIKDNDDIDAFFVDYIVEGMPEEEQSSSHVILGTNYKSKSNYEGFDFSYKGTVIGTYILTKADFTEMSLPIDLLGDFRNYETYYVDYPLSLVINANMNLNSDFKLRVRPVDPVRQRAATFIQLIDKLNPDRPIVNMLEPGKDVYTFRIGTGELRTEVVYDFTTKPVTSIETHRKRVDDRFTIRLYAAELPITTTSEQQLDWNSADSWVTKRVPQKNSHVVIPPNVNMVVNTTPGNPISMLTNFGGLEIKSGATLTVEENMELIPEEN